MANAPVGNIYTAALMLHNAHPDYKYEMEGCTCSHEGVNPSCGDELNLQLRIEGDVITGETVEEAKRLVGLFLNMIKGEPLSEEDKEDLDEAAELESISRMPARVKCAELAWRTLEKLLADK